MDLQKCIQGYIDSTEEYGSRIVNLDNPSEIKRAGKSVIKYFKKIMKEDGGKERLKELLSHSNVYVASGTAMFLIFEYPDDCEKVICKTIEKEGLWSYYVKSTYEKWKKGQIKPIY